jgi:hypothetical protein
MAYECVKVIIGWHGDSEDLFDHICEWEDKREEIEMALIDCGRLDSGVFNEDIKAWAAGFHTLDCLSDFSETVDARWGFGREWRNKGLGRRLKAVRPVRGWFYERAR